MPQRIYSDYLLSNNKYQPKCLDAVVSQPVFIRSLRRCKHAEFKLFGISMVHLATAIFITRSGLSIYGDTHGKGFGTPSAVIHAISETIEFLYESFILTHFAI